MWEKLKEELLKKLTARFIIAKLIILAIGVLLICALKFFGEVESFYYQIFLNSLIFATLYALFFTRNWTNWLYYGVLIGLVIFYVKYREMTVNSMELYLSGQAISASFILMFFYQIYKLLKELSYNLKRREADERVR